MDFQSIERTAIAFKQHYKTIKKRPKYNLEPLQAVINLTAILPSANSLSNSKIIDNQMIH